MQVLCFGSLNLDLVYTVEHIAAPGETIAAKERKIFPGGKGLNQSVAMARAGLSVCHAGVVGADGKLLLETLRQSGVNTDYVRQDGRATGHAMIQVEEGSGQNTIVLYGGSNREIPTEYIEAVLSHFKKGDWIVLQNEVNRLDEIIQKASAKGMHIVLNPSPFDAAVTACDLSLVSLFLINEVEGAQISGCTRPEEILDWMEKTYPYAGVVLTLGKDGAWFSQDGKRAYQSAFSVQAVDTTGAGDTFTGYFLHSYLTGQTPEQALLRATKAAAITVSRPGAASAIPTWQEVDG